MTAAKRRRQAKVCPMQVFDVQLAAATQNGVPPPSVIAARYLNECDAEHEPNRTTTKCMRQCAQRGSGLQASGGPGWRGPRPERSEDGGEGSRSVTGPAVVAGPRDLALVERFDDVALAQVLEVAEDDAALEAGLDLANVVVDPAQRLDRALPDHQTFTDEAHLGATRDHAVLHHATRNGADRLGAEDGAHLGVAGDDFFVPGAAADPWPPGCPRGPGRLIS